MVLDSPRTICVACVMFVCFCLTILITCKLWLECLGSKWPLVFGLLEWDRMLEFLGSFGLPRLDWRPALGGPTCVIVLLGRFVY